MLNYVTDYLSTTWASFDLSQQWSFVAFIVISSVTPGPNNSFLLLSGMRFGIGRSLPHFFGISAGFGALFLVGGTLLQLLPDAIRHWISYAAMGFILFIAWKIATSSVEFLTKDQADNTAKPWGFWKAFAFQWVNPKGLVMVMGAASAYHVEPIFGTLLAFSLNYLCGIWLIGGVWLGKQFQGNPKAARALLVTLGLSLALTIFL